MQKMSRRTRRRWARCLGTGMTALVAAAVMASAAGAALPANPRSVVAGKVAAISGSTMEVQNPNSGQTTVGWTTTTQFSKTVSETVGQVAAGDCVMATGTVSKSSMTTLAARTISITMPSTSGSCGAQQGSSVNGGVPLPGGRGTFGTGPSFRFRAPGSNSGGNEGPPPLPRGGPSRPGATFADLGFASGKVTAVNGSTVSVTGVLVSPGSFARPKSSGSGSSSSAKNGKNKSSNAKTTASRTTKSSSNGKSNSTLPSRPPLTAQPLTLTTSSSTTVTSTQTAAATDLAVGECVSAVGSAATNGEVTATVIRISSANRGNCASGRFPGGGFFGRSGGGLSGGGVV